MYFKHIADYASSMEYTSVTNLFHTPAGAAVARIHIRLDVTANGGSGAVYADSFKMKQENAVNLLLNGSFEGVTGANGIADNWHFYSDPGIAPLFQVVTTPVSAGNRAQKLAASNLAGGGLHVFQDTFVKGATTYNLSGKLQINDLVNAKASVFVYFFDSAYRLLGSHQAAEYASNRGYTAVASSFVTPAGTSVARIHIRLNASAAGGSGTVYADEFSIVQG